MITPIQKYNYSSLFSWLNNSSTLTLDLSQYKSIKNGSYKKLLKSYYKTYNSDGSTVENNEGSFVDELI